MKKSPETKPQGKKENKKHNNNNWQNQWTKQADTMDKIPADKNFMRNNACIVKWRLDLWNPVKTYGVENYLT